MKEFTIKGWVEVKLEPTQIFSPPVNNIFIIPAFTMLGLVSKETEAALVDFWT